MKPKKTDKQFHFLNDGEDVFNSLEPINLSKYPDLVERIYNRYPYVNRIQITLIVLSLFEIMRDLLLRGQAIKLRPFITNLQLYIFTHAEKSMIYPAVKVQIETPQLWKERPSCEKKKIK
jgi:hypothetical protein